MVSFEPSEEQQMLRDAVEKYASKDLRAASHEAEESRELPKNSSAKAGSLAFCKPQFPKLMEALANTRQLPECWRLKNWRLVISQARWRS